MPLDTSTGRVEAGDVAMDPMGDTPISAPTFVLQSRASSSNDGKSATHDDDSTPRWGCGWVLYELDWERAVEMLKVWAGSHRLDAGMKDLYGDDGLNVEEESGGFRMMNRSTAYEMKMRDM